MRSLGALGMSFSTTKANKRVVIQNFDVVVNARDLADIDRKVGERWATLAPFHDFAAEAVPW